MKKRKKKKNTALYLWALRAWGSDSTELICRERVQRSRVRNTFTSPCRKVWFSTVESRQQVTQPPSLELSLQGRTSGPKKKKNSLWNEVCPNTIQLLAPPLKHSCVVIITCIVHPSWSFTSKCKPSSKQDWWVHLSELLHLMSHILLFNSNKILSSSAFHLLKVPIPEGIAPHRHKIACDTF